MRKKSLKIELPTKLNFDPFILLLKSFGDEIQANRYTQIIGRMVRQIMENRSYQLDQSGARTRINPYLPALLGIKSRKK